jgi:hypothetical protein
LKRDFDREKAFGVGRNEGSFDGFVVRQAVRSAGTDDFVLTAPQFVYSIFGLHIHSNVSIPEIAPVQISYPRSCAPGGSPLGDQTVRIYLGISPYDFESIRTGPETLSYVSDYKDTAGEPALRIWKVNSGEFLKLEYFDGTQFWLDHAGTCIWATWPDNLGIEDAATYLLGPVLGLLLRLRGVTCLHASAVSFGDGVVAFVGSEGAGKSTTAAALARQGCGIVSDDVVALVDVDGIFHVCPAYPYVCLWPESVEAIYGSVEALPRFSRNYEKRCLSLEKQNLPFEPRSLPLKAIYVLGERCPDPAPRIERMSAQRSILALVANTFATNVLNSEMRAKEFETLGRLVPCTRIREVFAHTDVGRLPELCRRIREDVDAMHARLPGPSQGSIVSK